MEHFYKYSEIISRPYYSTIIHALISCRLDYCNSILYNVPTQNSDRLKRLQNQCARILKKIAAEGTYYPSFENHTLAQSFKIESHIQYLCSDIYCVTILH